MAYLNLKTIFIFFIILFNISYGLSYINNCSNLNINGETYILTTNVSSTTVCFNISANNITLDCNGNTIYSYNNAVANSSIITSAALTGIVIKNCNFIGNDSYILFFPYSNLNSKLINNSFKNCYYCSWIQFDNNSSIINNSFYNSRRAIHFVGTSGFNISNNLFSNISDVSISAGGSDPNPSLVKVIENNFFLNTYRGIYNSMFLTYINSNKFYNCGEYCIYLPGAQNNSIFNNTISNYSIYGLILYSSLGTNISTNIFNSTAGSAIVLRSSDVISVFNNTIYGPLILESSRNDTIFNNTILTAGIALHAYSPYYENENNQIFNNSIVSIDSYAIRLVSSKNNLIYNNILKGSVPVEVGGTVYTNYWNITVNCSGSRNIVGGPCIGGNFYANLNETGFSENINVCSPQSNKICGNSYTIQTNNIDYAPITNRLLAPSCSSQLNETNTIYVMWGSQVTPGTCYTITANNVTLDCKGYTITYATGSNYAYGIYSVGYNNSVIKNCKLIQNTAPRNNAHGIWFAGSSNNKVENVSINIVGNQSNGIYLTYSWPNPSNYNFIKNTTITMSGVQGHGIGIYGSYNNFSNISIVTTGVSGNGINFDPSSDSNYNIFTNISIKNTGSSSYAIQLRGNDNKFYNNLINSSSTSPVSVISGSNSFNTTLTIGTNIIGGNYIAGNFWATPSGNGFSEICIDSDGNEICDSTYTLGTNNVDYLPLSVPPIQLTSCGTLDKTGKTYLLIQNVTTSNDCFIINKSYITLDCQNNTITANRGVLIGFPGWESSSNITVKNCIINSAYDGIDLGAWSYNTNITILGNKIISQYNNGIAFGTVAGSNINISNNIIYSPRWGIHIVSGSGYITNNTIVQVDCNYGGYPPCGGLILYGASNFNILHNFINSTNAHGIVFADYLGTTADNNLVINNLIYTNYCGFRFQPYSKCGARNNIIANSTIIAIGTNSCGIYSDCPINTTWSNITINSEGTDFISLYSINNTYFNVTFNSSFYPTEVSFTHNGSIKINSADAVPSSGYYNISKYLNITNLTSAWVYINFTYSNDTIGENETKLKLYRWDGSAWNEVQGSGVDTDNKIVYANITQFSIFAPLAIADATPPSIQLISPENDTYINENSMTFIFNATDDQSSTLNCSLYINNAINQTNESVVNGSVTSFSLTNIGDGDYTWYVNCSDASGNSNVSETRTFTIDTIPPSVSITSPSSNSYINSKTITITGTSSDLNYNYTNISIWQGSTLINSTTTTNTSWSVQLGVQNDGIYNITATAYDKVGYNNSSSVQNIRIDTIPPSVSITSPSSNSYINSKTITITGTSSDLNYNYTNISIWQGSTLINSTITTSASWSVQLAAQDDGVYSISAVVYDLAGNENSSNVTDITVDTIIPQLTIISPLQSSPVYLRGSVPVQLKFNYNETNPANYTALLINSSGQIVSNISETLAISGDVNITASLSTTGLPNGNYSINVTIFDKVGQTITASEMNNVIIDNEIPGVIVNSPSSGQYIVGDTIVLNLTIFDDNLNYTQISIYNASESILNYTTNQSGTFTIDFTLPDDIYAINVTSFDLSGNNATATVTGVELDSTSPFYPNNCLDITLPGDYYLVNNIYSTNVTCIFIDADNVTVDGQGYEVRNLGNPIIPGIFAQDRANITIQNIIISHYDPDIQMINVTDAKIYNVTHNGGQIELIYTDAEIKNSRFENSSSKGMVANLSNIIINNTIIKNSQSDTLYMSSSNVSIFSSQIQNSNGVKGISISGQNNIITITSSDISLQTASNADVIDVDVSSTDNLYLSISDSNISNQNSFIHLRNSAGFESKNISINVFRNNIFNFSKIISSDSLVNGSGKILLTSDIHGNYWGRQSYPYVDLLDFQNVSDVSDEFPYKEVNGWNKEARFRLNSSSYNFASKDGKLSISMPYNPSSPNDNLVLSRLENEVFVITDLPLMHLAAENSIVNARLHYLFGTYESVYLPVEEREGLPLVTPLPIEIKVNLSDDFNTSEADNVSSVEFDENGFVKDLDGKFVFDSNEKSFKLKLSIINGSIDFLIGKKESDLILFDNVSPTVSLRQSGSIVIADYSDPLQQVTQRDDGRGNTYREVNSDQIIPLFLPNKAIVSNASIMLSPLSGTPSFNISIYLRNNITSLSSAERYYFNEISSLSSPIMLDLTSSMQSALGNCSQLHNGSYCLFYISINGLNDGEFNISEFNFNYSYSSGIKLPDVNTSGTITSLVEIPKHESDVFYLSDGGTDVLVISLPFKSYIKSAQITLSGEEWEGSYPSNVNMWIGNGSTLSGTPFVTYSGQFNTSIQVIAPFVYALRNYTSSADSDQKGNVLIPLTLNSSTKGKVRISSITIDYDLRNAYDLNSPSYIDGFNDGSEVKTVTFTNSSSSTILYIDVPKYSKVSNISIISSPSENITFNIDFLNDGVMEIENSTMIRQLNLTQYLENCSPYRFRIPYGRMCKVAINITANLDAYPSVDSDFEVTSEFISMPWAYAGSDSEIIRGSEKRFDFLTIPSGAVKRARSLSLEHHSIYSLQSGDIVIGYGLDMAGNRGSGNYTFIVAGPPTSPPVTPPLTKIPLSGWMNCTNSLAYVITEPGASVTVLFKSSGMFVTGGTADSNGRFEFTPLLSGDYSIRASKSGFEDNQITLTANICIVETQISAKKSLICSQDKCNINLYFATNKISDLQFRLTDFVPSSLIKTIDSIVDRFGKTFYSYSYTDSLISIPSTQKITSTFSVILDTVLTAIPNYIENENKFIYSITNTAADVELDEIIIPLPENAKGKEIASIEYIDADGSKINIMDYTVESDRIIIHQPVIIKKQ